MRQERLFLVNFSVKIHQREQVALVEVVGHLTIFEVGALRDAIQSLLKHKRKNILLNLSGLQYLDSSGIGELVSAYTAVKNQSGDLKLLHLTKKVRDLLQITKLYTVFDVFTDENTALRSFI